MDGPAIRGTGPFGGGTTGAVAKLLIDLERSTHARGVVLGMLREEELRG